MRRWPWMSILATLCLVSHEAGAEAEPSTEGTTTWNFDAEIPGAAPADFEFATTLRTPPGKWVVTDDGGNKVLAQEDDGRTARRYAMAIARGPAYRDLAVSVRGRPISGTIDQSVGIVWRWQGPDDYYIARSNVLERNVHLYKVVNGNRIKFGGAEDLDLATDAWQILAVEHRGTAIRVFLDARLLFETRDETIAEAGRVGLWTKADSVTWFDDLSVRELE